MGLKVTYHSEADNQFFLKYNVCVCCYLGYTFFPPKKNRSGAFSILQPKACFCSKSCWKWCLKFFNRWRWSESWDCFRKPVVFDNNLIIWFVSFSIPLAQLRHVTFRRSTWMRRHSAGTIMKTKWLWRNYLMGSENLLQMQLSWRGC